MDGVARRRSVRLVVASASRRLFTICSAECLVRFIFKSLQDPAGVFGTLIGLVQDLGGRSTPDLPSLVDLDGVLRPYDNLYWNGPGTVDLGAYEAGCFADFDGSGFVDGDDFDALVQAFEAGGDDSDFDGSGFVDGDDFDIFVWNFEAGC
jgi:hypothetical protein